MNLEKNAWKRVKKRYDPWERKLMQTATGLFYFFLIPVLYRLMPNVAKKIPLSLFLFFLLFLLFLSNLGSLMLYLRMQEVFPLCAVVSQKFLNSVLPSIRSKFTCSLLCWSFIDLVMYICICVYIYMHTHVCIYKPRTGQLILINFYFNYCNGWPPYFPMSPPCTTITQFINQKGALHVKVFRLLSYNLWRYFGVQTPV